MQLSIEMKDNLHLWVHNVSDLSVKIEDKGITTKESDSSRSRNIWIGGITITMFEEG